MIWVDFYNKKIFFVNFIAWTILKSFSCNSISVSFLYSSIIVYNCRTEESSYVLCTSWTRSHDRSGPHDISYIIHLLCFYLVSYTFFEFIVSYHSCTCIFLHMILYKKLNINFTIVVIFLVISLDLFMHTYFHLYRK